jgi:heat shock protein HslJ
MPISFVSSCLILPLVLVSASLLSACSSTTGRAHAEGNAAQNATTSKDSLALTSWELVRWTRAGGQLREIPHGDNGEPITLVFLAHDKPYQISGFAGCNAYRGTYKLQEGQFIGSPVRTRMACAYVPWAQLENDYVQAVGQDSRLHPG